ncbi:MAG: nucleotide-binding protein, partial [Gemmatimonadaceae bacterium]
GEFIMRGTVAVGLVVLFSVGCAESKGTPKASGTPAAAVPAAAAGSAAGSAFAPGSSITGTVREQIPVGPYIYLRLETPAGKLWAEVAAAPVTNGNEVTVHNVMRMERFASPSLHRTFATIYFGSLEPVAGADAGAGAGAQTEAAAAMPPGHPVLSAAPSAPATAGTPPAEDARVGRIARASGADAHTIGELWARKAQLVGKSVSVRGVVVKVNAGVMGRNWLHLQDGSGSASTGTHDLAVTSRAEAAIGDTVTVTGIVRTNRDVGAGYVYALLVEEAKVGRR